MSETSSTYIDTLFKIGDKLVRWWKLLKPSAINKVIATFAGSGSLILATPGINAVINIFGTDVEFSITGNDPFYGMILLSFSFVLAVLVLLTDKILPLFEKHLEHEQQIEWESIIKNDLQQLTIQITTFSLYIQNYTCNILNKASAMHNRENERLEIDKKTIEAILNIQNYIPKNMQGLLYRFRKIVSCSFRKELDIYYALYEITSEDYHGEINVYKVIEAARDIFQNYLDCYNELAKLLAIRKITEDDVKKALIKYNIGEEYISTYEGVEYQLAYQYILLPEYSLEKIEVR